VLPPTSATCGIEVDATVNFHTGVVVAIPRDPVKNELAVVVEIRLPTVSCVPVAERIPDAFDVMIELIGNVVALNTCEARVDVEIVLTCPFVPVKAKP
jgi:hypothetical protein